MGPRVLYVIDDGLHREEWEVTSKNWCPVIGEVRRRGVLADVVSLRSSEALEECVVAAGGRHVSLDARLRVPVLAAVTNLRQLIKTNGYRIVHANEVIPAVIAGIAVGGIGDVHTLFHRQHGCTSGVHAVLSRAAGRLTDTTLAISSSVARCAEVLDRTRSARIELVHSGVPPLRAVEPDELLTARASLGVSDDARVITVVGRLRPEKGHSVLFEALESVGRRLEVPVHLVVVGGGPLLPDVRQMAARARSFTTHIVGHRRDVAVWNRVADVVAIPSVSEPFGLVAIEAMSASRPVVASDVDGLRDIVEHGTTGFLVPARDAGKLSERLERLLRDPPLAREFGRQARARYERHFTVDRMIDRWVDIYTRVTATEPT